jgi:hypothetical protein
MMWCSVLTTLKVPQIPMRLPDQPAVVTETVAPEVPPHVGVSERIEPFNGVDLNGWDYSDDGNINWSVQNGSIVGKSVQPVLTSTYCLTKQHFTDFRLTITVKLTLSEVHSGISFWGYVPAPHHGSDHHTYAGHLAMFPSGWGMFDLLPDPVNAGGHIGRSMIFSDPGIAKEVGRQVNTTTAHTRVVASIVCDWRVAHNGHLCAARLERARDPGAGQPYSRGLQRHADR